MVSLQFSTDGISSVPGRSFGVASSANFTASVTVRSCIANERLLDVGECQQCAAGTYNVYPMQVSGACAACPSSAICDSPFNTGPQKGYWRSNEYSSNFLACSNPDACLGGYSNSDGKLCTSSVVDSNVSFCVGGWCASNYRGNLCANCRDGFGISNSVYCVPCTNNSSYYVITCVVVVLAIAFIVYTIRDTLNQNFDEDKGGINYNKSSVLIKIMLNYF
jgi:hypothetical protein